MTKNRMTKGQQRIGFKRNNDAEMYASYISRWWIERAIEKHRQKRDGKTEVFFACCMYHVNDKLNKFSALLFQHKLYDTEIYRGDINDIVDGLRLGLCHLENNDEHRGFRERIKNLIYLLNQGIYTNKERRMFCETLRTGIARG